MGKDDYEHFHVIIEDRTTCNLRKKFVEARIRTQKMMLAIIKKIQIPFKDSDACKTEANHSTCFAVSMGTSCFKLQDDEKEHKMTGEMDLQYTISRGLQ